MASPAERRAWLVRAGLEVTAAALWAGSFWKQQGQGWFQGLHQPSPRGDQHLLGKACSRLLHWLKPTAASCRDGQKSQAAPTVLTRRRFRRIFHVDFLLPRGWRHRPCAVRLVKTSSRVPSAPILVLLTENMRNGFPYLLSCGFPKRGAA